MAMLFQRRKSGNQAIASVSAMANSGHLFLAHRVLARARLERFVSASTKTMSRLVPCEIGAADIRAAYSQMKSAVMLRLVPRLCACRARCLFASLLVPIRTVQFFHCRGN